MVKGAAKKWSLLLSPFMFEKYSSSLPGRTAKTTLLFFLTPQTWVSQTETFASSPGTSFQLEPTGLALETPSLFRILPSSFVPQTLPEEPDEIQTSFPSTFFHADPTLA